MCGIAGIVSTQATIPRGMELIEAMNARLVHRGPDASGTWSGDGVVLGQRRLSIIDLSEHGRQPMPSADGATMLVCNGEIYNFAEVRRGETAEYAYRSNTDVEVILPLYERYGERVVEHIVGMFAIGLWDTRRRRLLLARDRIGEKPLYYAERDGMLAFASEIKALLTLDWIDRTIDEEAVTTLFAYQSLPAPFTIYRGIRQLAPAERLVWENGKSRRERYWSVDFDRPKQGRAMPEALREYERLLSRAVEGQLVSDVPVGVMLSGGIDSTTIATLARARAPDVRTFCIGNSTPGREDEEHRRASTAAAVLGTSHLNVNYARFTPHDLVRVLAHYDQPFSSLVALYADSLAQEMRRQVKVVVTGNGADEVLGGYAAYPLLGPLEKLRRIAAPLSPVIGRFATGRLGERGDRLLAAASEGVAEWRGHGLTTAARSLMRQITTDRFLARWSAADPGAIAANAARSANAHTLLEATTWADLMVCHQHGHSVIADMAGMAHGLEMRAPFLDHRLIEFASSLSPRLLVGSLGRAADAKLVAKEFLRRTMPASIVDAPKIGFGYGISLDELLRKTWRRPIEELLTRGRHLELGIFSAQGGRWALENSYFATCLMLSFAIFAEVHLFSTPQAALVENWTRLLAHS